MANSEESWLGKSPGPNGSFAAAAKHAAEQWEEDQKRLGNWPPPEPVRLDATEQYLLVGNPIHDYIVVLTPHHP